jgi:hypothetical protein
MDPSERLPEDLQRIDAALADLRSEVTAHDLDHLSQRIQRKRVRRARGFGVAGRPGLVGAVLSAALLVCAGAGTLAVTGEFSSTASSGDAQYSLPKAAAVTPGGVTSAAGKKTKKLHASRCRKTHTHKAKTRKGRSAQAQAAKARRKACAAKKQKSRKRHTRRH